jgi:hypothetical protein
MVNWICYKKKIDLSKIKSKKELIAVIKGETGMGMSYSSLFMMKKINKMINDELQSKNAKK